MLNKRMPFTYAELEQFYEGLVTRARSRGVGCAITSGMACVAFGVSETMICPAIHGRGAEIAS